MSQSSVERLITDGQSALFSVVRYLDEFLQAPDRHAAVRLALLGLVPVPPGKDEKNWKDTTVRFRSLFKDFIATKESPVNASDRRVHFSEHTIKRFAMGTRLPHDGHLSAYIALFIVHEIESQREFLERPVLQEAFALGHTLTRITEFVRSRKQFVLNPNTGGYDVADLLKQVRQALDVENDSQVTNMFFGGSKESHEGKRNVSYYAMYRYSTIRDDVVKSFLAIMGPDINNLGCHTFTHVYGKSGNKGFKRISRGVVLNFERSFYFLAGAGAAESLGARRNQGMKVFAIPHNAFAPDFRLLTGTMLSNSLNWEPIVARFALVHLGFRAKTDELTDKVIQIRFMAKSDLQADVDKVCAACGVPANYFDKNAAQYVEEKINNYPAVDRKAGFSEEGLHRALTVEYGSEPLE